MLETISVTSRSRNEFIDITQQVKEIVSRSGVKSGICFVYVPHTTAGITINEGADPSVVKDIISTLEKLVPARGDYLHSEGNSDAHIKASIMGSGQNVIVERGQPVLGTWQHIFFCEFDGPRRRQVYVKVVGG